MTGIKALWQGFEPCYFHFCFSLKKYIIFIFRKSIVVRRGRTIDLRHGRSVLYHCAILSVDWYQIYLACIVTLINNILIYINYIYTIYIDWYKGIVAGVRTLLLPFLFLFKEIYNIFYFENQ